MAQMEVTDRLAASPRGSAASAINFFERRNVLRRNEVYAYIRRIYEVAPQVGLDPSILVAQASHETGYFTSDWWNDRLNPAGIGITGDYAQGQASRTWTSGRDAADSHVAHMCMYVYGQIKEPLTRAMDPRYGAYIEAHGSRPVSQTIDQLTNLWGIDNGYAVGVRKHGREIFGDSLKVEDNSTTTPPPTTNPPTDTPSTEAPSGGIVVRKGAKPIKKANGELWDGKSNLIVNDNIFRADRRMVEVNVDVANLREYANHYDKVSAKIGTLKYGDEIEVLGWVSGTAVGSESRWWVLADHSRLWVGCTSQKPR